MEPNKIDYLKELKEEIKAELFQEIEDKTREIVRSEIKSYIFDTRSIDLSLRIYIKSLCHDEIHYLKMLNRGLVKHGSEIIEIPEWSTGNIVMNKKKDVNLKDLYKEYTNGGYLNCSFNDFKSIVNFEFDCNYVAWTDKARKTFTYKNLFALYNRIYDYDFSDLNPFLEERFLSFISVKFLFQDEIKDVKFIKKAFNKAYKG
ncbi:hypothetical protein [uncultured Christiangramia sp.]|uniref:hypothetical protein n=1 Tax=uncultured Christiangramia sp. TaxID=503836 RepID=UPI00260DA6CF|nr:hypothetical protein [uncultured Christiangramia sp.]